MSLGIQEMTLREFESSGDGEFVSFGVQEMGRSGERGS